MAKYLQIEHETTLRAIDAALEEFHIELPTGGAVHRDHGVHLLMEQLRRVEAEVDRLRAANAELVAACRALLKTFWYDDDADVLEQGEIVARAEQAIAKGEANNG